MNKRLQTICNHKEEKHDFEVFWRYFYPRKFLDMYPFWWAVLNSFSVKKIKQNETQSMAVRIWTWRPNALPPFYLVQTWYIMMCLYSTLTTFFQILVYKFW